MNLHYEHIKKVESTNWTEEPQVKIAATKWALFLTRQIKNCISPDRIEAVRLQAPRVTPLIPAAGGKCSDHPEEKVEMTFLNREQKCETKPWTSDKGGRRKARGREQRKQKKNVCIKFYVVITGSLWFEKRLNFSINPRKLSIFYLYFFEPKGSPSWNHPWYAYHMMMHTRYATCNT